MARIARRVRVTGRVQGVFFRAWTAERARGLGVTGWIRNRPDGSVEAHVEGEEPAVRALVEQMRSGPPGADVSELASDDAPLENGQDFVVRH
jgi:acylphosphatase